MRTWMVVALALLVGCSRESGEGTAPSTMTASAAPAPAPVPVSASAAASAPASPAASAAPPAPASAPGPRPAPTCGDKPLPPCPLYAWMKANTGAAMSAGDFDALGEALGKVATMAPPGAGYPNWVSIAKDGQDAARVQNLDAVKAACRGCHNQYRAKYRAEMRDRPI